MRTLGSVARLFAAAGSAVVILPALGATRTITIEDMQFVPDVVTVKRGDHVVWLNKDLVPHTVTAAKVFDSGAITPGKSWRMSTVKPGRYDYVCTLHPTMKATLLVE